MQNSIAANALHTIIAFECHSIRLRRLANCGSPSAGWPNARWVESDRFAPFARLVSWLDRLTSRSAIIAVMARVVERSQVISPFVWFTLFWISFITRFIRLFIRCALMRFASFASFAWFASFELFATFATFATFESFASLSCRSVPNWNSFAFNGQLQIGHRL